MKYLAVALAVLALASCSSTGNLTSIMKDIVNADQAVVAQVKEKAAQYKADRNCLAGLIDGSQILATPSLSLKEAMTQATASADRESDDYKACREYAAYLVYQAEAVKAAIGGISDILELIR